MTWTYNGLSGRDENWILRNFIIALGYGLYSSAALQIMVSPDHQINEKGYHWIVFVTVVAFIMRYICDIKDTKEDRIRGRDSALIIFRDEIVQYWYGVLRSDAGVFWLGASSFVSTLLL